MAKQNILIRTKLKKAATCLEQGRLADAVRLYTEVCRVDRANPDLWTKLGLLHRKIGDHVQAEHCSRKAIQLFPAHPLAHHALAATLHSLSQLEEAIALYQKAIQLQPDLIEAHYYLANALRENGDFDDAVNAYTKLLSLIPDHFEGLNNFGALLTNMERCEEAVDILTRALNIRPDTVEVLTNLGRSYSLIGNPSQAHAYLLKAINLQPDFIDTHLEMAWNERLRGNLNKAFESFDRVLQISPGHRKTLLGKAKLYEVLGEADKAYRIIEPLLNSENYSDALLVFFDISKKINQRGKATELIQKQLKKQNTNVYLTAPLHNRLGKYFDQEKQYDKAFGHFKSGNILRSRKFDIDKAKKQIHSIMETYNPKFAADLACSGSRFKVPVFIVGMPRSGTSLLEQIIASHPDVYGAGETDNVSNLANQLSERYSVGGFPDFISKLTQSSLDAAANELEKTIKTLSPTSLKITDKMPHNFLFVGFLMQLFPDSKIIHCQRNPLDTCLSCYTSDFASNFHDYTYNLETLGRYYLSYKELMDHWESIFPNRILPIRYEDIIENQEKTSKLVIDFCNLEWSSHCLNFHQLDRVINTISYDQVRQPLYKQSVNRWRHYEKHLSPLRDIFDRAGLKY